MSITREKFVAGMAVLAGAFGREIDGPVQRLYYSVLSPKMDDAAFEQAVSRCAAEETYWPSPAKLLSKLGEDEESLALEAFEHVNRTMNRHGGPRFLPHAIYRDSFDAPTKAAITAVGGLTEIANTSVDRWPKVQRDFAKAYADAKQPKLAPPVMDHPVKQLVSQTARSVGQNMTNQLSGRDRAAGERT